MYNVHVYIKDYNCLNKCSSAKTSPLTYFCRIIISKWQSLGLKTSNKDSSLGSMTEAICFIWTDCNLHGNSMHVKPEVRLISSTSQDAKIIHWHLHLTKLFTILNFLLTVYSQKLDFNYVQSLNNLLHIHVLQQISIIVF